MTIPRATTARTLVRVLATLVAVGAAVWGGVNLASLMAKETKRSSLRVPASMTRFDVPSLPGTLEVSGSADGPRELVQEIRTGVTSPDITYHPTSDGVTYSAECAGYDSFCRVNLFAKVDESLPVRVSSTYGDVRVRGIRGPVEADASAGDVTVEDVFGAIRLRSSGGDMHVRRSSSSDISVESSAGSIDIDLLTAPTSLVATSSAGDVTIVLPRNSGAYDVEVDISAGDLNVQVDQSRSSPRRIRVLNSAGDVSIRYAE